MSTPASSPGPGRIAAGPARERILDAAATIMRRDGLVRATTKEIAREAGCSEALLYKNFADKADIFLHVLLERLPPLKLAGALPDTGSVVRNLEDLVGDLLGFYEQGFAITASIFSSAELLSAHREAMTARGAGPQGPSRILTRYLDHEVQRGQLLDLDTDAVARLLTGAALHEAFLAAYTQEPIAEPARVARRLVAALNLSQ